LEKRDSGAGILLVSPELDEIIKLSDRIAVMYRGKIMATVACEGVSREELGLLMAGVIPDTWGESEPTAYAEEGAGQREAEHQAPAGRSDAAPHGPISEEKGDTIA
jgi:ABC-type sugar transport system ATPase subunit